MSMCNHLYFCYTKHESVVTSLPLVHHHMDHFWLLPFLVCNFPFQWWEIWLPPSAICLLHCSILVGMHSGIIIVNLQPPWETALWTRRWCWCTVLFAFRLTDSTMFEVTWVSTPLPSFSSVKLCHMFKVYLEWLVMFCILSWDLLISSMIFFKFACIKFTLCAVKFY